MRQPIMALSLYALSAFTLVARAQEDFEGACPGGPTTRDTMFALGGATLTTVLAAVVLVQTLAKSLASSGYRQSSANSAAFGLAAFFGGGVGASVMALGECSVTNVPGGVSLAMASVGLILALFSFATGRA